MQGSEQKRQAATSSKRPIVRGMKQAINRQQALQLDTWRKRATSRNAEGRTWHQAAGTLVWAHHPAVSQIVAWCAREHQQHKIDWHSMSKQLCELREKVEISAKFGYCANTALV
jgi:hypothetical protein